MGTKTIRVTHIVGGNIIITTGGSTPSGHPETRFTLEDGTVETHNITGTLDQQWMIDNGYYDDNNWVWIKTITQADIGNTVTNIGEYAFSECSGLTIVTIPDGVTSIGDDAFNGCSGLMSVTIPNSVTSIGDNAFLYCGSLTSMTIPDNVTNIGGSAFEYCNGLTSVTFNNFDVSTTKTKITENHIFGTEFYDENNELIEKTFRVNCTNGSFDVTFGTDGSITFTDL